MSLELAFPRISSLPPSEFFPLLAIIVVRGRIDFLRVSVYRVCVPVDHSDTSMETVGLCASHCLYNGGLTSPTSRNQRYTLNVS